MCNVYVYVLVIWSFSVFNNGLSSYAYKYLPINLSSPNPNQKYVSKWDYRSSLKFVEL